MQIESVNVYVDCSMEEKEILAYMNHIRQNNPNQTLQELYITVDGDFVDLKSVFTPMKFERIRRITGYLVGTIDRWNNAKRSEEQDRVKHS